MLVLVGMMLMLQRMWMGILQATVVGVRLCRCRCRRIHVGKILLLVVIEIE